MRKGYCRVRPVFQTAQQVRADIESAFPGLVGTKWLPKSPYDDTYQCIAWAAGDTSHKWWPIYFPPICYWPQGVPYDETVNGFIRAFETLGYKRSQSRGFEFGWQKVAIYAKNDGTVTHMARQHFFGRGWLSKPGDLADILHLHLEGIESDPSPMASGYGTVAQILERSWWIAARFGLFRCWWAAFQFWLFRIKEMLDLT
jgi:hypothetical protein